MQVEKPTTTRGRTPDSSAETGRTGPRRVENAPKSEPGIRATPGRTAVPQGNGPSRTPSVNIRGRTPAGPSVDNAQPGAPQHGPLGRERALAHGDAAWRASDRDVLGERTYAAPGCVAKPAAPRASNVPRE